MVNSIRQMTNAVDYKTVPLYVELWCELTSSVLCSRKLYCKMLVYVVLSTLDKAHSARNVSCIIVCATIEKQCADQDNYMWS